MQPQAAPTQLKPHTCIISGPTRSLDRVRGAFTVEGIVAMESDGHGLPSHVDPLTAAEAGAPNAGHTPGTPHPEVLDFLIQAGDHKAIEEHPCIDHECEHVGQTEPRPNPLEEHHGSPYEADPDIEFLAVECDDPDRVTRILDDSGWQLRMLISPVLQHLEEDITPEDRLARIEHDMAILKGASLS